MSRQSQILALCNLYPIYIVVDCKYNLGEVAFNVVPPFIICLLLYVIVSSSRIKLNHSEKRSIWFLIWFKVFISIYYELCVLIAKIKGGFQWISQHNYVVGLFILFTLIFYYLSYLNRESVRSDI